MVDAASTKNKCLAFLRWAFCRKLGVLILVSVLSGAVLLFGESKVQSWTGEISDDMCMGNHASMGGKSAKECSQECVKSMGSKYALVVDKKTHFELSDQKSAEPLAGKKVKVTGVLDGNGKGIKVQKIEAAP